MQATRQGRGPDPGLVGGQGRRGGSTGHRAAARGAAALRPPPGRGAPGEPVTDWCWPAPRPSTWSDRWPRRSASTPSWPPATRSRTAPSPAPSTATSCGTGASWPPSRSGRPAPASRWPDSYAYSDSYFDAPLLAAVGHPTAVNPDLRMAGLAALRGWPVRWLDKPPGVPKVGGFEPQELLRPFAHEAMIPYARFTSGRPGAHPPPRPGHRLRQPPVLLRPHRGRAGPGQAQPQRPLPRQEGGVRRSDPRPAGPGLRRHPRRPGLGQRPAARGGGAGPASR